MSEKPSYEELEHEKSECRHLKKALQESQEKFQILSEQSIMSIAIVQKDGIVFVNDAYSKLTGYSKKEIFAMSIAESAKLIHPDYRDFVLEQGRKKMLGETKGTITHYIYKGITKSGAQKWVEQFSKSITWEGKPADLMTLIDITEHQLAKEALRESEEKYRDIFESLIDVYFKTDIDGTIENVSPSAEKILGYSMSELIGQKVAALYQNPDDREALLKELKEKGQVQDFKLLFKKKNNEAYHISVNAKLNYSKHGELLGLTGNIRDITQNRQAQKEKIRAQKIASEHEKLALVGQIAGKMAHDFNNVLGIIMGNSELALLDCKDDQITKTLELIYQQTIRGKNLTKNLIAFAKDQEPKQEFLKVNEKIDLVINLLKKDLEGIELIREYKSGVPDLLADPGMIEHAIVNLIQNAIHAVSLSQYPKIVMRTSFLEDTICFEIEDNGCGIPEEYLGEIYEPSFTLKGGKDIKGLYKTDIKGTGYGLSNVKKYIEQHKGKISIDSQLQKGTRITIHLPVTKKELTQNEIIAAKKAKINFEKYILIVEDEQAISDIQYRILTQEPFKHKVDVAGNAQIAIDLLNRNEYDLVSLDYILPGSINGMDIYNHIRETNKTVLVLFISGNIEFLESTKDLKQKDPYIDHLSKPCKNINYVNTINKLFEKL